MDHTHGHGHEPESLNRTAFAATWYCLTGCAIGEVLGLGAQPHLVTADLSATAGRLWVGC